MTRIKIDDLPRNMCLNEEEMRTVVGGKAYLPRYEVPYPDGYPQAPYGMGGNFTIDTAMAWKDLLWIHTGADVPIP